jgi:5-methylcytosine-specific restriction enzyme subunit McrC
MVLKDCSPIPISHLAAQSFGGKTRGIEPCRKWLRRLSQNVMANELVLPIGKGRAEHEPIVYTDSFGEWWVGRYIGSVSFEGITLTIEPRFEMEFVAQQLPLNKFAMVNIDGKQIHGDKLFHYLQALMWFNLFSRAAKHSLPVVKVERCHVSDVVRGRLDVRASIRKISSGSGSVVSISAQKELLNPLSICIALAFNKIQRWFPKQNLLHWLPPILALRLQQVMSAVSRHHSVPSITELNKVRYTSLTVAYKPLIKLSLQILNNRGSDLHEDSASKAKGLLLDVAELWEIYVLKVLKGAYQDNFDVVHGTEGTNDYLLTSATSGKSMGKLLPDFLVKAKNSVQFVADAKYKRLGDAPWLSPKRDDLYQMNAYMSRYQAQMTNDGHCMLIYPEWADKKSSVVNDGPWLFSSGEPLSFVTLPIDIQAAVLHLKKLTNNPQRKVLEAG